MPIVVNAGVDQSKTGTTATLTGTITSGSPAVTKWQLQSASNGQGSFVVITNNSSLTTGVSGLQVGTYVFALNAFYPTPDDFVAFDAVSIVITA